MMDFKTGKLSQVQIEAILNALPGDMTFADADGTIRYYNEPKAQLFSRKEAILGTSVQSCHPEKSIGLVSELLQDLKTGRQDVAESWTRLEGRLIHIRYFAVRDRAGEYLGCLEFVQNVSDIVGRAPADKPLQ